MKYRDAKHLHNGDQVKVKATGELLVVSDIEVLGVLNIVRLNCVDVNNNRVVTYNGDVE